MTGRRALARGALALASLLAAACGAPIAPVPPVAPAPSPPAVPALPAASCDIDESSPAPDPESLAGATLARVCFSGHLAATEPTLRRVVTSKEGAPFSAAAVAADLRSLFNLGRLSDVKALVTASREGPVLTFAVTERPMVARVRFEGAHAITDANLHVAFQSPALIAFDPVAVRKGLERLRDEYDDLGYPHSAFTTRTADVPGGVELIVTVSEGAEVKVASLTFPGAKSLPEKELVKMALTRVGQPYKKALFQRDLLVVNAAYYDRGMLQVTLAQPEVVASADERTVALRVPVTEGPVFRLKTLAITGDVAGQEKAYRALVPVKVGDVFSRSKLIAGMAAIKALRQKQGKSGEVDPQTELEPDKHTVRLNLVVR